MLIPSAIPITVHEEKEKTIDMIQLDDNITNFKTKGNIVIADTAMAVNEKNNTQPIELYVRNQATESDTVTIISRKKEIKSVMHSDSANIINQTKITKNGVTFRANRPGITSAEIRYKDGSTQKVDMNIKKYVETTKTVSSNIDTGGSDKITIDGDDDDCKIQKTKDGKYKVRVENENSIKYEVKDDRVTVSPNNGSIKPAKIYIAFDDKIKVVNINNTIKQSRIIKEKSKVKETHKENMNTEAVVTEGDCVKITKSGVGKELEYEAVKPGHARIKSKWKMEDQTIITIYYDITVTELPKKEKKTTSAIIPASNPDDTNDTIVFDNTPVTRNNNTNTDVDCRHNTGNYGNSIGLTAFAHKAYREGWTYVWGGKSYGAVDCSGLIAAYCPGAWSYDLLNDTKNSYPGNDMAYGSVSNGIPRIHGLGLHQPGHVGVYVGNGMEIDARCEGINMCYQAVAERNWDYWYRIQHIKYPDTGFIRIDGDVFYYEDEQYVVNCEKEINGKKYKFDQYGRCDIQPDDAEYEKTTWVVY